MQFPRPSNACSNFDDGVGWTFFDLTTLHDEFADEPGSVVEADFYHAGILLPMRDEDIVDKVTASALLPSSRLAWTQDAEVPDDQV